MDILDGYPSEAKLVGVPKNLKKDSNKQSLEAQVSMLLAAARGDQFADDMSVLDLRAVANAQRFEQTREGSPTWCPQLRAPGRSHGLRGSPAGMFQNCIDMVSAFT